MVAQKIVLIKEECLFFFFFLSFFRNVLKIVVEVSLYATHSLIHNLSGPIYSRLTRPL